MGVKALSGETNAADFAATESFDSGVLKEFGSMYICENSAGISKGNLQLQLTSE